jgi:hypothetical protein
METTLISWSLSSPSLPFASLPIEIQLFQSEIMIGLVWIMVLASFIAYRYILQSERKVNIQWIDNIHPLHISNTETIGYILLCVQENTWLFMDEGKNWYEKLLSLLESEYQTSIDRTQLISTQSSIPTIWKNLLSEIEKARYSPTLMHEQKEQTRQKLIHELTKLQNNLWNSSIQ